MYYLIYKITNRLNNKIYVGKHKTEDKSDGYFGSGTLLKRSVEKHGKENFSKEILIECSSEEEMNQKEADIVDEDFIARDDTYNIKLGGQGGFDHINKNGLNNNGKTKEQLALQGKRGAQVLKDKFESDSEFRNEQSEKRRLNAMRFNFPEIGKNAFTGKHHTDETRKKMSEARKGKFSKEKNPNYGKIWITNGNESKMILKTDQIPDGWRKGHVNRK